MTHDLHIGDSIDTVGLQSYDGDYDCGDNLVCLRGI